MLSKTKTISIFLISFFLFFLCEKRAEAGYRKFTDKQLSVLVPSSTRFVQSLSGKWQRSYDEINWDNVMLPSSNASQERVRYRRTIKIDKDLVNRYVWELYFLGLSEQVEVYVNGQYVGRYFGGMTPFHVRIPNRMLSGETNTIELTITPTSHKARQIKDQNNFAKKIYNGVIRDILLVGSPQIRISEIDHYTEVRSDRQTWDVNAALNISTGDISKLFSGGALADSISFPGSEKVNVNVEAFLRTDKGNPVGEKMATTVLVEPERTTNRDVKLSVSNPALWSPKSPNLYQLVTRISKNGHLIDEKIADIGFRNISITADTNGSEIRLNGRIFSIKGIAYIEDYNKNGQTVSPHIMEQDVRKIKTLGANTVRFKYSPPHPYFAKLCNRYGLMMMVELPVYEVPADLLLPDEIKVMMKNIAKRYSRNYKSYPSLLAWGISDGIQENHPDSKEFFRQMLQQFNPNSNNLFYKTVLFGAGTINTKNFDFICVRHGRARYKLKNFNNSLSRMKSLAGNTPVIACFGIPIQTDNYHGYSDPLSIESQSYYILNSYKIIQNNSSAGLIFSNYNDYKLNNPQLITNNGNQYLCAMGLVDRYRKQRLSFETLQTLYNDEKEPLLNAGSYSESTPVVFIIVGILLGIILVLLVNRFRRFREYLFRSLLRPYNFYADIRDQRIMSSVQTVLLGVVLSLTLGIFYSSIFYFYRTHLLAEYVYMLIIPYNSVQEIFFRLIWMPELLMLFVSAWVFIVLIITALIIKIFALFVRARIFYKDTFTITVWSTVPVLILLPFAIILIRLLVLSESLNWLIILLALLLHLWVFIRILKATSIVFDMRYLKVYTFGFGLIIMIAVIIIGIYQYQYSIFDYGQYFFDVLIKY